MNAHWRSTRRPVALLLLSASSGCVLASDLGQLGVFHGEDAGSSQEAGEPAEGSDASAEALEASVEADAGPAASDDPDAESDPVEPGDAACPPPNPPPDDSQQRCFDLRAFSGRMADKPYDAISEGDGFVTFTVKNPDAGARYVETIKPIIDNGLILHDMRLYQHRGAMPEGVALGKARGLNFVFAWSPGFTSTPVSGLVVEPGGYFTLELHYITQGVTHGLDTSGTRVCLTASDVTRPVSFSRVGSETFSGASAQGTCTPTGAQAIDILGVRPDMGAHGQRGKLFIRHASGELETVYDMPFTFDEDASNYFQFSLPPLKPGEAIVSSCGFSQSVQSGSRGEEERCGFDILHSPPGALVSGGARDTCLQ